MRIERQFSKVNQDVYTSVAFCDYTKDQIKTITMPVHWSEESCDLFLSEILCNEDLPTETLRFVEKAVEKSVKKPVPEWLQKRKADTKKLSKLPVWKRYFSETDIRQVLDRVVGSVTYHLWCDGVFDTEEDAIHFYDDMRFMIIHQKFMPEIALLKKIGLDWAYGLKADNANIQLSGRIGGAVSDISSICHSDMNLGYAGDKWGMGHGPVMPWLRLFAQAQQCRSLSEEHRYIEDENYNAAERKPLNKPLIYLDVSHPESHDFMTFQQDEQQKDIALSVGKRRLRSHLENIMDACGREDVSGFDPTKNMELNRAVTYARRDGVSDGVIQSVILRAISGDETVELYNQETDKTLSEFQMADISHSFKAGLRLSDDFFESALTDHSFAVNNPVSGNVVSHMDASKFWDDIANTVWSGGQTSLMFSDTVNLWNTCEKSGDILSTDHQGGFMFLEHSDTVMGQLNAAEFIQENGKFNGQEFVQATTLSTLMLDSVISILSQQGKDYMAEYRPIGLGITNIGHMLMSCAVPYHSDKGRGIVASIMSLMTGVAYKTSADLAQILGAFKKYGENKKSALATLQNHFDYISGESCIYRNSIKHPFKAVLSESDDRDLLTLTKNIWRNVIKQARISGIRHAQVTYIAPSKDENILLSSRTIALNPERDLTCFEKYFSNQGHENIYGRKVNPSIMTALRHLDYNAMQIDDIHFYITGHASLFDAPVINHESLKRHGFCQDALNLLEHALKTALDIRYAFNKWVLGEDFCLNALGFSPEELNNPAFDMLESLGFSNDDIDTANLYCCGAMFLTGAPHISEEHIDIFDMDISAVDQIKMMASIQPYISGGIGGVLNVAVHTSMDDVQKLCKYAWETGLKNITIYREGSGIDNLSPIPLSSVLDKISKQVAVNDENEKTFAEQFLF